MKRVIALLIALIIAIPLSLSLMAGVSYVATTESTVPNPALTVMGTAVPPDGYTWREPVFAGMVWRDFAQEGEAEPIDVGILGDAVLPVAFPEGYEAEATVTADGEALWSGSAADFLAYRFHNNGAYEIAVECLRGEGADQGFGRFNYHFQFTVAVTPGMEHSTAWVAQGDVLAIRVYNIPTGQAPTAETTLGPVNFLDMGGGVMVGFVPVSHDVSSATHPITVTLGEDVWEISLRSTEPSFPIRYEQEDAAPDPAAFEAAQIAKAQMDQQYYNTIWPVLQQTNPARYWSGHFVAPVDGEIVNDYGMFLYTSASPTPTRQTGIDIRAAYGAPVLAPNNGVVVYTGQLATSGNTVVLDHGGGLKSLFFHLNTIGVEVGQTLETSEELGTVGQSGNAAGAAFSFLHYEARLNTASLNPNGLFDGSSNLYYYE